MIPVGISNRHVHLTKEVKDILFGCDHELEVKRNLNQIGEFASNDKVSIRSDFGIINDIRVIGPLRKYTQVEILKSDEEILGLHTEERNSGDLENTPGITLIGPKGEIYVSSCVIVANRHIHMTEEDAEKYNVKNDEIVKIKKDNTVIDNVHIKIKNNYVLECHLDKDDEIKYNIHSYENVEIVK